MDIGKLVTSLLVFALFGIALISFGVNFANENDAGVLITDNDSAISTIYTGINNTLYTYDDMGLEAKANESVSSFNEDSGTSKVLGVVSEFFIGTLLVIGKTISGISNAIFNVTFSPILKGLGIPNGIAKVIGGIVAVIMSFSLILLAWKLYRVGQ